MTTFQSTACLVNEDFHNVFVVLMLVQWKHPPKHFPVAANPYSIMVPTPVSQDPTQAATVLTDLISQRPQHPGCSSVSYCFFSGRPCGDSEMRSL